MRRIKRGQARIPMRAANETTSSPGPARPPLVILINGTWAFGIRRSLASHWRPHASFPMDEPRIWSDCSGDRDSFKNTAGEFQLRLSDRLPPGTRVEGFRWNGYNGLRPRSEAAGVLADRIRAEYDAGTQQIFLVAHSHGGNIAQQACAESGVPVSGIVALATPFISAARRTHARNENWINAVLISAILFLLQCWFTGSMLELVRWAEARRRFFWFLPHPRSASASGEQINLVLAIALGAAALIACVYIVYKSPWAKRLDTWRLHWISHLTSSDITTSCLAIRASGDEAHTILMIGQILDMVQRIGSRGVATLAHRVLAKATPIFNPWLNLGWMAATLVIYLNFNALTSNVFRDVERLAGSDVAFLTGLGVVALPALLGLSVRLAVYVLWTCVFLITRLMAAAGCAMFGVEYGYLSFWIDLQVETRPDDRLFDAYFFSKNKVNDLDLEMRHGIYNMQETAILTADWIARKIGLEKTDICTHETPPAYTGEPSR
jgi:pimeloyl-ACP methyl ester carboxylesterase